mgnify:CR=1 FL=1
MQGIIRKVNKINITVDYRTELLGVIMLISEYHNKYAHLFLNYDNNKFYVDMIIKHFVKYKNEEVIKIFDEIVKKHSFNYDAPFCLFLQLNNQFNTVELDDYTFKNRLQSDNNIYYFISKLDDFSKKINFEDFYNNNKKFYQSWIDNISGAFEKYDISNFFKNYYGYLNEKEFVINLTAFTTNGAYCCNLKDRIVCCFPVFEEMKKDKLYDSSSKEKYILQTPIHEFSHGYVNPITDKYDILNQTTNLFVDIKENMKKQAYPYDTHIINEHIVRGIEARYIYLIYKDKNWYKKRIREEKEIGFKYIDSIIKSLIYYENNRSIYKTFDKYYPLIIENIIIDRNN